MDPRGTALFLVFALLGASARANPDSNSVAASLDWDRSPSGDSAPLADVKASLQALKGFSAPSEKSREIVASLSRSAARLRLSGAPAAALARLKAAAAAGASLKEVTQRGDEFLAALAGPAPATSAGTAANSVPPASLVIVQPENVSKRALGVLNGASFGKDAGAGSFLATSEGPRTPRSAGVVTAAPAGSGEKSDLGIAVPAPGFGGPPPAVESRFHDEDFDPATYRPAALRALDRMKDYVAPKLPGMPSFASVADLSAEIARDVLAKARPSKSPVPAAPVVPAAPATAALARPIPAPPPPHVVVGTTGGVTVGKYIAATGRAEIGAASLEVTAGSMGRPDLRYGLDAGDLKVWVSHRPAGDLMRSRTAFGASTALDSNTQLTGSVTIADTRKGTDTTFMLGISGALAALAP